MNIKRYITSVLAVFITFEVLNFIIHSVILSNTYMELESVWRADMMEYMWLMYIADLIFVAFATLIYAQWMKIPGLKSGLMFGLFIGVMIGTSGAINQFVIYPITNWLMWMWIVFGLVQYTICGIVLGLIYRSN